MTDDGPFGCPTCCRFFSTKRGMRQHHTKSHGVSISTVEVQCEVCGDTFTEYESEADESRACGVECRTELRSKKVDVECEVCGVVFSVPPSSADRRRVCGMGCVGELQSREYSGEDHPSWNGGTFPYGPGWSESKKEAVRERDERECQHCGRSEAEHVELFGQKHHVHHIQPARTVDDPGERNAMSNLVTLCCGECHQTWEEMAPDTPQTTPSD